MVTKAKAKIMTKAQLIETVTKKSGLTKKDCTLVMNYLMETIKEELAKGTKVTLIPYGSWMVRERAAREGRNPQTGKKIKIPAKRVPAFRAGKALREAVK